MTNDETLSYMERRLVKAENLLAKHGDEMEAIRLNQVENKVRYENLIKEMGGIKDELGGIKRGIFWAGGLFIAPFIAAAAGFILSGGLGGG